jgi:hypothetical protein
MAETNNTFIKAFLPGLVIGVIVGASAAVLLPETLNRPSAAQGASTTHTGTTTRDHEREPLPQEWIEEPTLGDEDQPPTTVDGEPEKEVEDPQG